MVRSGAAQARWRQDEVACNYEKVPDSGSDTFVRITTVKNLTYRHSFLQPRPSTCAAKPSIKVRWLNCAPRKLNTIDKHDKRLAT